MKWYNVEIDKKVWEYIRPAIKERKYHYEISGCYDKIHLEIKVDEKGLNIVNSLLDEAYDKYIIQKER